MEKVRQIVKAFLVEKGYDGLVHPMRDCGCMLDDLMPCDELQASCEAAYKGPSNDGEWDFVMYASKEDRDEAAKEADDE